MSNLGFQGDPALLDISLTMPPNEEEVLEPH